ncbi:hypothetical protein [Nocardia sp. NPDC049149]|uniref:hypothetical protein n=1 Tax=Nocardia sp. NPDC049149 TaxID=3364315 RepID=UPI00371295F7
MATRSMPQPPFSAELLADLHAGNVAPELGEQLWPVVRGDGESLRYLHALDDVSTELRALGRSDHVIHAMPDDVAARLALFIDGLDLPEEPADEGATIYRLPYSAEPEKADTPAVSTPPTSTPAAPVALDEHRRGRLRWLTAAAAAVAVVACAAIALTSVRGNDAPPIAQPTSGPTHVGTTAVGTKVVAPTLLDSPVLLAALGRNDASGLLASVPAQERCVRANGLERSVLGSTDFVYDGKAAVLLLLSGPRTPKITALIVGTGCTTDDPQRLALQDIG